MRRTRSSKLLALAGIAAALGVTHVAIADEPAPFYGQVLQLAQNNPPQQQRSTTIAPIPELQRWAIALGALYTHREGETSGWAPNLEIDYTATDKLLLHFMAPLAFDQFEHGPTHFGLGDIELGARYRFIDEQPEGWRPNIAFFPLLDLPSGSQSRNLGTGHTHAFLPLWFSKTFGPWLPYASAGYWLNPGPPNRNWFYVSAGAQRTISDALTATGEIFHASSSKRNLKDQTGFDVGGRYNITANHHVLFSIGRGLQNAAVTNEITTYLAYLLTF